MAIDKFKLYKNIPLLIVFFLVGIAMIISCFIYQFDTSINAIIVLIGVSLSVCSFYTIARDYLNFSNRGSKVLFFFLISFIVLVTFPFVGIYHCENNKCTESCYAITYSIQKKDLHIDENTKYIGLNNIENSDLYNYQEKNNFINNITINHDILNLEKLKNNSFSRIKLFSIDKLILFPICLVIIGGIYLYFDNKQSGKYLLILLLLVIVRILYLFTIVL